MNIIDDKNRELCKALWLEHEPGVRKLCEFRLQSCISEVDDVIADTFFYLLKAIDSGDLPKNPRAWLYSVAHNLIKKKYTEMNISRTRFVSLNTAMIESYELAVSIDIDDERIPDSLIEELSSEIKCKLKEDECHLLEMVYEKKMKMKEIAAVLNSTETAVKQKNYRMNRKIKKLVKEYIEKI